MSRKSKPTFGSSMADALSPFQQAITTPIDPSGVSSTSVDYGRWFFWQNSAPSVERFTGFTESAAAKWLAPFSGFWSSLAVRHRAIQLASSIRGQEFARWLAVTPLDNPIGEENAAFLDQCPWFAPLTKDSLLIELAMRYVDKLTSLEDANCHVLQRDLMCYLPGKEAGFVSDAASAQAAHPVTIETIGELQVWALNALMFAHESLLSPHVLDTRALEVEAMRAATSNLSRGIAHPNPQDRTAVARSSTLQRRASLSRSAFFAQATKRGLDHDKARAR